MKVLLYICAQVLMFAVGIIYYCAAYRLFEWLNELTITSLQPSHLVAIALLGGITGVVSAHRWATWYAQSQES